MPRIYRIMRCGVDNKPEIGESATSLGVRVPKDIQPDGNEMVQPQNGGMSVAPSCSDLNRLPATMQPQRLRELHPAVFKSARGLNQYAVFAMGKGPFREESVSSDLSLRPDPNKSRHGFVEPGRVMALEEYRTALAATRDEWDVDEEL